MTGKGSDLASSFSTPRILMLTPTRWLLWKLLYGWEDPEAKAAATR